MVKDTKAFFVINPRFSSIIVTPNDINHGYVFKCSAGNKKFKLFRFVNQIYFEMCERVWLFL